MSRALVAEFVVRGTPPSLNKRTKAGRERRAAYKQRVSAAAAAAAPAVALSGPVFVEINYGFTAYSIPDIDNFIKMVLDGSELGGVFDDDRQVTQVLVRRIDLGSPYTWPRTTSAVAEALKAGDDFVQVVVEEDG